MTVPVPPDRIGDVVRRFLTGMQVPDVAPDVTSVGSGAPPRAPSTSVGPASPQYAQPVGGVMGALLSAGPVGERMVRDVAQHPFASAAEVTGVPSMYRGMRDGDLSQLALGAMAAAPYLGAMGKGMSVVERAAPAIAASEPAGLTADQLHEWRQIDGYLRGRNTANVAARDARGMAATMRTPSNVAPYLRAGAEDMAIPANVNNHDAMLRNILETGFAGGKAPTMVELPANGAGRGGSTATAMAAARKAATPTQIRTMVSDEIARRGGASSPEVEMAATEEVARRLASHMPGLLSVAR